jgi:thioesterase domain-containing protein
MNTTNPAIVLLPGANGKAPDTSLFGAGTAEAVGCFKQIDYPRWRRCIADDFSADATISDLADKIAAAVPRDPIYIVGISIGGHFGYAAALRLQAGGRTIGGLCAVDTFMVASAAPRSGWQRRALSFGLHLAQKRRLRDLMTFFRARFWRVLVRLPGSQLRGFLNKSTSLRGLASLLAREPIFEEELSLRLLLREINPWVSTLDIDPVPLKAPVTLIRTTESAGDDPIWQRRCPDIEILETSGTHQTMFDPEYAATFRECFLAGTRSWRTAA